MVRVAQLVPQNVEKLPLWHWRPGSRLLVAGDRDGAGFVPPDAAAASGFTRALDADLLAAAQRRAATDGLCAAWHASLTQPRALELVVEHARGARVVCTSGHGDPELLARVIAAVDAWVLLIGEGGPLDAAILERGRHVEVVLGLDGAVPPERPYGEAAAIHLMPRRPHAAVGEELAVWERTARAAIPDEVACYGQGQRHTHCADCGRVLIWRYGGRSRIDGIDRAGGCCQACGTLAPIRL